MAEYTRIKKSKRLRYKVIQLMYLIFLILSIIQIPSDWISVNLYINNYIERPNVEYTDPILKDVSESLDKFELEYLQSVVYIPDLKRIKEPNAYTKPDKFFFDMNKGNELFLIMKKIYFWSQALPTRDKRRYQFRELFRDDLINGIADEDSYKWVKWRWKHIPAVIARNFIKEIKLRMLLLNKSDFKEIMDEKPLISMKSDVIKLFVNEEAFLSVKGDSIVSINVTRNNGFNNDYRIITQDSIVFKPSVSGNYRILLTTKTKTEETEIEVVPNSFPRKESIPFRLCYQGVSYAIKVPVNNPNAFVKVDGDEFASYDRANGELKFNIQTEGWSSIKVNANDGVIFHDSVYVKSIPDPNIVLNELPSLTVGRQRLKGVKELNVIASHPSFDNKLYGIESMLVKWVGANPREDKIEGGKILINENDLGSLKYIIIHTINVRLGSRTKIFDKQIIVPVL